MLHHSWLSARCTLAVCTTGVGVRLIDQPYKSALQPPLEDSSTAVDDLKWVTNPVFMKMRMTQMCSILFVIRGLKQDPHQILSGMLCDVCTCFRSFQFCGLCGAAPTHTHTFSSFPLFYHQSWCRVSFSEGVLSLINPSSSLPGSWVWAFMRMSAVWQTFAQ